MKHKTPTIILCGACALLITTGALRAAAETTSEPKVEKKMRIIKSGEGEPGERRVHVVKMHGEDAPREKVAFLGVETGRVSHSLAAQIGLAAGTGLTVHRVVADSPVAGVIEKHDVLVRFNDQLLVNEGQLSVLIRAQKPGDSATLTFIRGGKENSAKVKLGEREVRKMAWREHGALHDFDLDGFQYEFSEAAEEWGEKAKEWAEKAKEMSGRVKEDVERTLRVLRSEHGKGGNVFISSDGPGKRVIRINKGVGNIVLEDKEGHTELKMTEGGKHLVVKDGDGKTLFDGPVSTDEQRAALATEVRARLDKVESMQGMEFKWTDDAEAEETSVLVPGASGRGVSHKREESSKPVRTLSL